MCVIWSSSSVLPRAQIFLDFFDKLFWVAQILLKSIYPGPFISN